MMQHSTRASWHAHGRERAGDRDHRSGEKFFCAGANIQMLSDMTPEFKYYFCLHANETLSRFEQTPKGW